MRHIPVQYTCSFSGTREYFEYHKTLQREYYFSNKGEIIVCPILNTFISLSLVNSHKSFPKLLKSNMLIVDCNVPITHVQCYADFCMAHVLHCYIRGISNLYIKWPSLHYYHKIQDNCSICICTETAWFTTSIVQVIKNFSVL
jgi:hypothetical protein